MSNVSMLHYCTCTKIKSLTTKLNGTSSVSTTDMLHKVTPKLEFIIIHRYTYNHGSVCRQTWKLQQKELIVKVWRCVGVKVCRRASSFSYCCSSDSTVPVCGDTSWWSGQALTCGYSYTNSPCRNMEGAQQFSTGLGYGSVAGIGKSEWVSSSFTSNSLMRSFSCSMCSSSADILWASDSQSSTHWLLMWHSCMQREKHAHKQTSTCVVEEQKCSSF